MPPAPRPSIHPSSWLTPAIDVSECCIAMWTAGISRQHSDLAIHALRTHTRLLGHLIPMTAAPIDALRTAQIELALPPQQIRSRPGILDAGKVRGCRCHTPCPPRLRGPACRIPPPGHRSRGGRRDGLGDFLPRRDGAGQTCAYAHCQWLIFLVRPILRRSLAARRAPI